MVGILRLPSRCAADQSRRCEANAPSLDSANGTASARQHWIVKDARKVESGMGRNGVFFRHLGSGVHVSLFLFV